MKGIIVYSSRTGNTKKMAEAIYQKVKEHFDVVLNAVEENQGLEGYDFALLGGYTDQARPDKKILTLLQEAKIAVGLFTTLGAMPDSEHGQEVRENMEELLAEKESLGVYLCPGYVDPKLVERIPMIPDHIIPPQVKEEMIETSKVSRHATEEELAAAAEFFDQVLQEKYRG